MIDQNDLVLKQDVLKKIEKTRKILQEKKLEMMKKIVGRSDAMESKMVIFTELSKKERFEILELLREAEESFINIFGMKFDSSFLTLKIDHKMTLMLYAACVIKEPEKFRDIANLYINDMDRTLEEIDGMNDLMEDHLKNVDELIKSSLKKHNVSEDVINHIFDK
jgi:hypothetical protein